MLDESGKQNNLPLYIIIIIIIININIRFTLRRKILQMVDNFVFKLLFDCLNLLNSIVFHCYLAIYSC